MIGVGEEVTAHYGDGYCKSGLVQDVSFVTNCTSKLARIIVIVCARHVRRTGVADMDLKI